MSKAILALGDVTSVNCWSGTPFHFWKAAYKAGFALTPGVVKLNQLTFQRFLWNLVQLSTFKLPGGFQYSNKFLEKAERQLPVSLFQNEIISFNQHFPRSSTVNDHGGQISYYLDAPFIALATGRGLNLKISDYVKKKALELEIQNYESSRRLIVMSRWAADIIKNELGIDPKKLSIILPGANIELPKNWSFKVMEGRPGKDRLFTLGFIGKDWRRKGLPLLIKVREELVKRGWRVRILAAGVAPNDLTNREGIDFVGFIDKEKDSSRFLDFLSACDFGCLFSTREAFGISVLEFLRAGVPVVGFDHEGPSDSIPPDAGIRVPLNSTSIEIANQFEIYLSSGDLQLQFRQAAQKWSPLVSWDRCINEFRELWSNGFIEAPVRPWTGAYKNLQ
jgi:glycosyltransferase involved in cell wall biosynthesis